MVIEERELSIIFSIPSSMYTRLILSLNKASSTFYTKNSKVIKNIYKLDEENYSFTNIIRTIQSDYGYEMQLKTILSSHTYKYLYKHVHTNLTLLLNICDKISTEQIIDMNNYKEKIKGYRQIIRNYIYCKQNGIRIAVESHFNNYIDPDVFQMDYDCFNRYKFECFIHIELEYNKDEDLHYVVSKFIKDISCDDVIFQLFTIMSNANLNNISDEIICINNMSLTHKYCYSNINSSRINHMKYFSLKYDGIRKNFCIFGRYIHIDGKYIEFKHHWFGQVIIGHCEIVNGLIFIIDIYIMSENFFQIAKKYNMSYTDVLENYHHFYNNKNKNIPEDTLGQPKTQDEYFHMKRLSNVIKFIDPIDAIYIIKLLSYIWKLEPNVSSQVFLQTFFKSINKMITFTNKCPINIDGYLGYSRKKIFKLKKKLTIDLLFKFDEMFRYIHKKMKNNNQDIKRIIKYINIQKTLDWIEFNNKYPKIFNKYAVEYLFFSQNESFHKYFKDWKVSINLNLFNEELERVNGTFFVLLLEFDVDSRRKKIIFKRLRDDKFSSNSINVFKKILKQL